MNTSTNTAAPLQVLPWVTVWEKEAMLASITVGGKVHRVTRTVTSENSALNVADPEAKRREGFLTLCGTDRRGRWLRIGEGAEITCAKCAKA